MVFLPSAPVDASASLPQASIRLAAPRRLADRRPTGDLGLHELIELRWRALVLCRDGAADVGEPLLHSRIVERPVERVAQPLDDLLRRAFGRKHAGPDGHAVNDAEFFR